MRAHLMRQPRMRRLRTRLLILRVSTAGENAEKARHCKTYGRPERAVPFKTNFSTKPT